MIFRKAKTEKEVEKPVQIKYWAENLHFDHNMPCSIHFQSDEKAVYDKDKQVFGPSWQAQLDGWMLIRPPKWMRKFLSRYSFDK